jgi:hypothetical protein
MADISRLISPCRSPIATTAAKSPHDAMNAIVFARRLLAPQWRVEAREINGVLEQVMDGELTGPPGSNCRAKSTDRNSGLCRCACSGPWDGRQVKLRPARAYTEYDAR